MSPPYASVVLLAYNTRDLVLSCLDRWCPEALREGWQVLVVDNGSEDGTAQAVAERFPSVQLLRSSRNLGYAAGNNLGLRKASGEAIVLLNSDVVVDIQALRALVVALAEQADVGALSAGLVTAEGMPQAFAFGAEPRLSYLLLRCLRALLRLGPLHPWDIDHAIDVDWVSGACLCVRRRTIEQVGLLDERFFLYFEDVDWCLRMHRAGWRVVYDPRAPVIHLGGASQSGRVGSDLYYRSLVAFYAKHYGPLRTGILRFALVGYKGWRAMFPGRIRS